MVDLLLGPYLYGPTQIDARFNGHIIGGLEEGSLQEQSEEEQHSQHISILQKLFGRNEIDPKQSHLEAEGWREEENYRPVYRSRFVHGQGWRHELISLRLNVTSSICDA